MVVTLLFAQVMTHKIFVTVQFGIARIFRVEVELRRLPVRLNVLVGASPPGVLGEPGLLFVCFYLGPFGPLRPLQDREG